MEEKAKNSCPDLFVVPINNSLLLKLNKNPEHAAIQIASRRLELAAARPKFARRILLTSRKLLYAEQRRRTELPRNRCRRNFAPPIGNFPSALTGRLAC
nr:hypothetical protein Itr_chr08CG19080 [Ipomoea trifida]